MDYAVVPTGLVPISDLTKRWTIFTIPLRGGFWQLCVALPAL